MEREYGKEKTRLFLNEEMRSYLWRRTRELGDELPLKTNFQNYVRYSKGSIVMYALQDYIGEDAVNKALRSVVDKYGFKEAPYPTTENLVEAFRKVTPDSLQYIITDMFETITLYDNKTTKATYTKTGSGKYKVNLTIESQKFRADGKGSETQIAVNDYMDIGIFGKNGKALYLKKHTIDKTVMDFDIDVDGIPTRAGIDPYLKLIDKNRNDNTIETERL